MALSKTERPFSLQPSFVCSFVKQRVGGRNTDKRLVDFLNFHFFGEKKLPALQPLFETPHREEEQHFAVGKGNLETRKQKRRVGESDLDFWPKRPAHSLFRFVKVNPLPNWGKCSSLFGFSKRGWLVACSFLCLN